MRIAYFLADHGIAVFGDKGASVHVQELASALCRRGHETTIFCTRRGPASPSAPFEVRKIRAPEAPPSVNEQRDTIRRTKEKRYMAAAEQLVHAFLEEHQRQPFDAIYERYSLWSAAGVEAARETGLPLVLEVNAPLLEEQAGYRELAHHAEAERLEQANFRNADVLAVVSREIGDYAKERRGSADAIQVIPNGVDPEHFHPRVTQTSLPEADGRFVIAFSGSLKQWHGVEVLMAAFRELVHRLAGMHLLVIGDGPLRDWMNGYVAGAGLESCVTFTGWRPHQEIPALLARADVAVAPYPRLDHFYFSPLKLFEYLALGKPVVASDTGQIGEILERGNTGLLVPPSDVVALADALERLWIDKGLRQRLAKAAIRRAGNFTWDRNAERIEAIYTELAGNRRSLKGSMP